MKMIDMATPKTEKKAMEKAAKDPIASHDYYYGTRLNLEKGHIDRLDISHLNVGDEVYIMGKAKVTSKSQHEREGDDHHSMELQMTHMGVSDKAPKVVDDHDESMKDYAKRRNAELRER